MKYLKVFGFLLLSFFLLGCPPLPKDNHVLVFTKTQGYVHESIPTGINAIQLLGAQTNFTITSSEDAAIFNDSLSLNYDAIVFLNTTGDILNDDQQKVFEAFIKSGKGFVGIHAATDTEYNWPFYTKLVGAQFDSHPDGIQSTTVTMTDSQFVQGLQLPNEWAVEDEIYNFKKLNTSISVIATIDESSYKGGLHGDFHPISWYRELENGRAFYTALGHTKDIYSDENFLKLISGGIQYAIGKKAE